MVIPIGGLGPQYQLSGAPPEEAQQDLMRLKWSIIAMGGFSIVRLLFSGGSDLMNVLNVFLAVVIGAFLLKEDEHFKKFYDCLATSICQQCAEQGRDGLQCLLPFLMFDAINVVFDLLFNSYKIGRGMPYGLFLLGSIASQAAAAYFGYNAFKICRDMNEGAVGTEMEAGMGGGSGYVQAGEGGSARNISSLGGQPGEPQASSFTLFQGQGTRLGG
jgi:hypothetical protein